VLLEISDGQKAWNKKTRPQRCGNGNCQHAVLLYPDGKSLDTHKLCCFESWAHATGEYGKHGKHGLPDLLLMSRKVAHEK
jgi:hypothetical protein